MMKFDEDEFEHLPWFELFRSRHRENGSKVGLIMNVIIFSWAQNWERGQTSVSDTTCPLGVNRGHLWFGQKAAEMDLMYWWHYTAISAITCKLQQIKSWPIPCLLPYLTINMKWWSSEAKVWRCVQDDIQTEYFLQCIWKAFCISRRDAHIFSHKIGSLLRDPKCSWRHTQLAGRAPQFMAIRNFFLSFHSRFEIWLG